MPAEVSRLKTVLRRQLPFLAEKYQVASLGLFGSYVREEKRPGSDLDLGNEMVILFATYDGLGMEADGLVYPAANHNASGIGMLLELARLWQEQGLDARRTTMFVA